MGELYDLSLVRYSKEVKPQLKSFINLDENKLGLEVNWELQSMRFFIYKKKKKHQLMKSQWIGLHQDKERVYAALILLVKRYYKLMQRLEPSGDLPMYTKMELKIPASHLHFHANAGTLQQILDKEIIYN